MSAFKQKILFVNSEIFPYLPESDIANIGRYLPQGVQDRKREIRSFMPRFGCINERKNQLHEVIRLSGMNIIIGDVDRPLIIKVASISSARIQVYFIDNEDYFRRKQTFCDAGGKFFEDNDERAIFFARGVLETVKKLRWAPDVIHCQGWISHLDFCPTFADKACFGAVKKEDLGLLEKPDGINLARTAAQYSDGVILGAADVKPEIVSWCKELGLPVLPFNAAALEDGSYVDEYCGFYDEL